MLIVPEEDWQTLPAAKRASVDRENDAELAAARAELTAASAGVAGPQRTPPEAGRPVARPPAPTRPDPDADEWERAIHDHEQTRVAAFTRIEAARTEWQRADAVWRERRLATAEARLAMIVRKRELVRAQVIDHSLPGADHYDVAPLRGQFSRAQQHWHLQATRSREARAALDRASAMLASAKEAYAQLMRGGPAQLAIAPPDLGDERARLELTGWAITRGDIARRRGLRRYLEAVASTPPRLRKTPFRLRAPAVVLPAEVPGAAPGPAPRIQLQAEASAPAGPPRPAAPTPSTKSWDNVEPAGRAPARPVPADAAAPAARATAPGIQTSAPRAAPAAMPVGPSSRTATGKTPAPRAAPAAMPWDAVEPPSRTAAGKTPAPRAAPAAMPWDAVEPPSRTAAGKTPAPRAAPAAMPWDAVEPPSWTAAGKTAPAAARGNVPARAAAATAKPAVPPVAATSTGAPAMGPERPPRGAPASNPTASPAPAASPARPASPRSPAPSGPSAHTAKPVEAPATSSAPRAP
jgi:hypothetical protein